ncbi:MAG: hypothetical protein M3Y72_12100 [Acidobacteriota bacterium]|nr:hypothetical protein [Acidobacteriota bacterium]
MLSGIWPAGTPDEANLTDCVLATPWVQIEAGMPEMAGILICVMHEGALTNGVFGVAGNKSDVYHIRIDEDWDNMKSASAFSNWLSDVHDFTRIPKPGIV